MENIEQRIKEWLIFNYSSFERFAFLRVLGKTWEKEMKKFTKIPVFDINIILPPNFFQSTITLIDNNQYEAKNIGLTFEVILEDPNSDESDEDGVLYKIGRCTCSIKGVYSLSDPKMAMLSITPVDFKYDKLPKWIDKGEFYDISDWLCYWMRYVLTLPISIKKMFAVSIETANQWIEEQKVPKSFKKNLIDYGFLHKHHFNIAEKMFPMDIR